MGARIAFPVAIITRYHALPEVYKNRWPLWVGAPHQE